MIRSMHDGIKRPVTIFETVDTFIEWVPWGVNRAVLVHRREHGGKSYVRFRAWNRHQVKKVWYPTRRGFIVPLDQADELAFALALGASGEPQPKPEWFLEWEREEAEKAVYLPKPSRRKNRKSTLN